MGVITAIPIHMAAFFISVFALQIYNKKVKSEE
jgi:hypothetical protein